MIHNNTDDQRVLRRIDLQGISTEDYPTIWPLTIQPRSYALMRAEVRFDGEPNDDLTGMTAVFERPEADYDFRMQINSVEWTDTGMRVEVENQFEKYDAPPGFADGLILWFDAEGKVVAEKKYSVDVEDTLAPGESARVEVKLDMSAVPDDSLFLTAVSTLY